MSVPVSISRQEQKISTVMLCNILGVLVRVDVGKGPMVFAWRDVTSRFQEINGRWILVMEDESQGIHTTVMRIDVHKVDGKFLAQE